MLARISNQKAILHIESSLGCSSRTETKTIYYKGFSVARYFVLCILFLVIMVSMNTNEKSTTLF